MPSPPGHSVGSRLPATCSADSAKFGHPAVPRERPAHARKWLTTIPSALMEVRNAVLDSFVSARTEILYLYEADNKVVVRAREPQREIRLEMVALDALTTRIIVSCLHGQDIDRTTSARILAAVENLLA